MTGVVIPVIVHLWNDRRGKVLRVGSVALLTGASRKAAWSVRVTQVWLLVLRCLLVIALAGLLAGPYRMRSPRGGGKGWVLADISTAGAGGEVTTGYADVRRIGLSGTIGGHPWRWEVDTLLKSGYELHVMDSNLNYFEAFRRIDRIAPEDVRFVVFTPDLVSRWAGTRLVTDRRMDWELYSPADPVTQWVEGVWRISADSVLVLRGSSQSTGTGFQRERVAFRGAVYDGVVVDTAALEVVLDGGGREEGEYMRAALRALGEYTGRRLRVVSLGTVNGRVIRWQPEWSEAAWNGQLPVVMGRLLFGGGGRSDKDRRGIDLHQLMDFYSIGSERLGFGEAVLPVARRREDLRPVVWVVVFLLFVLERIKAFWDGRQKT